MIYYFLDKTYKNIIENNFNINFINIKNILFKKNIITRTNKLNFIDVLCYVFNYSFIELSKQCIVSNYNFDNNINVNRTSYYKLKIPLSFYSDIFFKN